MSFPPPASLEARGGCDGAVPPSGEPGDWRHSSSSQAVSWAAVFDSVCGSVFASVEAGVAALSQSALSQHLARMREEGLIAFRREAQTLYYRIEHPEVARLMATLKTLFCPDKPPEETA